MERQGVTQWKVTIEFDRVYDPDHFEEDIRTCLAGTLNTNPVAIFGPCGVTVERVDGE
jgi:hypothetical protein